MSRFQQILDPTAAGSLALSALVAAVPLTTLFVLLGVFTLPALRAALISLGLSIVNTIAVWRMPVVQTVSATAEGAIYGVLPILWILVNAIWLHRLTVITGWFEVLGERIRAISDDQRILDKMLSPQTLAVAAAAVGMVGKESEIFCRLIWWSLGLLAVFTVLIYLQSTQALGWMVP